MSKNPAATKRAVSDIPIFLDNRLWKELNQILTMQGYQYKVNKEDFQHRDRALTSLLLLTGCRISEALDLKKLQFRIYPEEIILANIKTKKHGKLRTSVTLPKQGKLEPYTLTVETWLNKVPEENHYVFPHGTVHGTFQWNKHLSTSRSHRIIKTATGKFPHWYRGVCETIYGKLIFKNDAWKLAQFMGLKRLDSTTPYVQSSWKEDEKNIYKI
jgi:integrase